MGQLFEVKWGHHKGQIGEKNSSYSVNKQTFYSLRMQGSGQIEHIQKDYLVPYKKPKEPTNG